MVVAGIKKLYGILILDVYLVLIAQGFQRVRFVNFGLQSIGTLLNRANHIGSAFILNFLLLLSVLKR